MDKEIHALCSLFLPVKPFLSTTFTFKLWIIKHWIQVSWQTEPCIHFMWEQSRSRLRSGSHYGIFFAKCTTTDTWIGRVGTQRCFWLTSPNDAYRSMWSPAVNTNYRDRIRPENGGQMLTWVWMIPPVVGNFYFLPLYCLSGRWQALWLVRLRKCNVQNIFNVKSRFIYMYTVFF